MNKGFLSYIYQYSLHGYLIINPNFKSLKCNVQYILLNDRDNKYFSNIIWRHPNFKNKKLRKKYKNEFNEYYINAYFCNWYLYVLGGGKKIKTYNINLDELIKNNYDIIHQYLSNSKFIFDNNEKICCQNAIYIIIKKLIPFGKKECDTFHEYLKNYDDCNGINTLNLKTAKIILNKNNYFNSYYFQYFLINSFKFLHSTEIKPKKLIKKSDISEEFMLNEFCKFLPPKINKLEYIIDNFINKINYSQLYDLVNNMKNCSKETHQKLINKMNKEQKLIYYLIKIQWLFVKK